jgi:hypothetical protein
MIASTMRLQNLVNDQREIMHIDRKPHPSIFVQNSVMKIPFTEENTNVWVENSFVGPRWHLTHDHVITGVPENIPVALVPKGQMNGHLGDIRYYKVRDPQRADFHIRMTYGLPDLYFRGVLAHEMLHSWLALYGRQVTTDECEGFCNLGEAFVYTKEDTPLAHYLLKQMYKNADAVYGDGYRLQKQRYEKLGWEGLLKSLRYF